MRTPPQLFENNRTWASEVAQSEPALLQELARQQSPDLLWIGCSDSRVPANTIVGLPPGELFVHRNVANLVSHSDMNCLSVIQYAVDVLKTKHIVVCGHYGCGGVRTAIEERQQGPLGNWLAPLRSLHRRRQDQLVDIEGAEERVDRLCELNVAEQVKNVSNTDLVQEAWARGQVLTIHGWMYRISSGLLKDLGISVSSFRQLADWLKEERTTD